MADVPHRNDGPRTSVSKGATPPALQKIPTPSPKHILDTTHTHNGSTKGCRQGWEGKENPRIKDKHT